LFWDINFLIDDFSLYNGAPKSRRLKNLLKKPGLLYLALSYEEYDRAVIFDTSGIKYPLLYIPLVGLKTIKWMLVVTVLNLLTPLLPRVGYNLVLPDTGEIKLNWALRFYGISSKAEGRADLKFLIENVSRNYKLLTPE
jgi:hypothetical protein